MTFSILGCGWLGLPLGAHLVARGHRVRGATTTPGKRADLEAAGITPYLLRLDPGLDVDLDAAEVAAFFEADALFFNVPPPRGRADGAAYYRRQVDAVRAACVAAALPFVVFAGATSVYPDAGGTVTEASADASASDRAAVLMGAEACLHDEPRLDVTVLRYGGLYGYGRHPARYLAGRTGVSGGARPVNMIHRDDAVAVAAAVLEGDVRGEVLNACADGHPTRRVFYTEAAERLDLAPPLFADDEPGPYKIVSNSRLKERLAYRFMHPDPLVPAP